MKKQGVVLILLLVGSLTANIYYFNKADVCPVACDNKGRYSEKEEIGALRLSLEDAGRLVDRYRIEYPPDQNHGHPTGFVFTKRMFDEVFSDADFNSVTLDFVSMDENISLVVKGFKTDNTKIDGTGDSRIYVIKTFCPDNCSVW